MPTDIAEKMIALKRKQATKYVSIPPLPLPLPFPFSFSHPLFFISLSAMSESRTGQNVRLSLHKALRHPLAGRSPPPASHHLRCL